MEDCSSFATQVAVLLTPSIEILARKTTHPLVSEDALPWSELFLLENASVSRILCAHVALNWPPFHASNGTGAAMWNFNALLCGNDSIDSIMDFEFLRMKMRCWNPR